MKKVVYRLTENDLHNMIKNTVDKILKESIFDNNNMSVDESIINNIDNIDINEINDNEAIFDAYGKDGSNYQIYVSFYVSEGMGEIPSNDYDVPNDFDSDTIEIESVHITKWNEMNEEEEVPYNKNIKFEQYLSNQIEEYLHSNNKINNSY